MDIPIYQVDAFAASVFKGNPAAVCPLDAWPEDSVMQSIAAENNLAETAFFVPKEGGWDLRWFTPVSEIDLCGHATLASAFVIFERLAPGLKETAFDTRSGRLVVRRRGEWLEMDFPAWEPKPCEVHPDLVRGLGAEPLEVLATRDYLAIYGSEDEILALRPDMRLLVGIDRLGVIVTAPGREADFVSRFFAPGDGVDEDQVTGSAHSTLIPFWAGRLGRTKMRALQLSARGGELLCEARGERVLIAGRAVLYMEGVIRI